MKSGRRSEVEEDGAVGAQRLELSEVAQISAQAAGRAAAINALELLAIRNDDSSRACS
jgi:hypothetical protein